MQQSPSPSGRGVGVRGNEVTMVHHHGLRSPLIRPSGTFSRREKGLSPNSQQDHRP